MCIDSRVREHPETREELRYKLDRMVITSKNIGDVRRSLFSHIDGLWNALVRDETAARENKPQAKPMMRGF